MGNAQYAAIDVERVILRDLATGENKNLNVNGGIFTGLFLRHLEWNRSGDRVSWGGGSGGDSYLAYTYDLASNLVQEVSPNRLFYYFASFGGDYLYFSSDGFGLIGEARGYHRYDPISKALTFLPITPVSEKTLGTSRASKDGNYLAYWSIAANVDQQADLYLYNLQTAETRKVTEVVPGLPQTRLEVKLPDTSFYTYSQFEANRDFFGGDLAISDDGRFVAYVSNIDGLDPSDHNGRPDIYVYDRVRCLNALVSRNANLESVNGNCVSVAISGDGRVISYSSDASDIISDDDNLVGDIFVTLNPLFAEDLVQAKVADTFCRPTQ